MHSETIIDHVDVLPLHCCFVPHLPQCAELALLAGPGLGPPITPRRARVLPPPVTHDSRLTTHNPLPVEP